MTTGNWERIQDLFLRAADLPQEEQATFLDANCDGNDALRSDVESLLAFDGKKGENIAAAVRGAKRSLLNAAMFGNERRQ